MLSNGFYLYFLGYYVFVEKNAFYLNPSGPVDRNDCVLGYYGRSDLFGRAHPELPNLPVQQVCQQ